MKIKQFWQSARRKLNLGMFLLYYHPQSIVSTSGWSTSFRMNQAVDRNLAPIPWCTYSFLNFIEKRLNPTLRVFEYGCGNSTLYYSSKVNEIIAVEHDPLWAERISSSLSSNGKVVYKELDKGYVEEVKQHGLFDIIVIDGRRRTDCCKSAVASLKPTGVLIYDNSERRDFQQESWPLLQLHGFRELPFCGLAPITFTPSQTSILYRNENCLEI